MPTMTADDPKSVTLPTETELEQAIDLLEAIEIHVCELAWRVRRVADVESIRAEAVARHERHPDDEVPTLRQIGMLFSFYESAMPRLREISKFVDDIAGRSALYDLDSVRLEVAWKGKDA